MSQVPPRYLTAIFCDDVRPEMYNKYSLMGLYETKLLVTKFPLTLPKLCVVMTFVSPRDVPVETIDFRLLHDDVLLQDFKVDLRELSDEQREAMASADGDALKIRCIVQVVPVHLQSACLLKARAIVEPGGEELRGGTLAIESGFTP